MPRRTRWGWAAPGWPWSGRARRAREAEYAAELDAHLTLRAEAELAESGGTGEAAGAEARRRAERSLGNELRLREDMRAAHTPLWVEQFLRDLALAGRMLRRQRGFAAVTMLTLGLGLGANAALYSVVEAVILRPLPVAQPGRLVAMLETSKSFPQMSVSYPDYRDWTAMSHVFSTLAATRGSDMILSHAGEAAFVMGNRVSASYFALMGVEPELGRVFTAAEDRAGAPNVVVLSDRFWRTRLGGDPRWLGRSLDLDSRARTVVGVMPPGYPGPEPMGHVSDFWTPLGAFAAQDASLAQRGNHAGILVLGRLRPGVDTRAAAADMAGVAQSLAAAYPQTDAGNSITISRYTDFVLGDTRPVLWMLFGAVSLVLIIACANVAGLLVARDMAAARTDAVRQALGASRLSLLRARLAEALALGVGGAGAGAAVAWLMLRLAPSLASLPRGSDIGMDRGVFLYVFALGLAAMLAATLAAWMDWRGMGRRPGGGDLLAGLRSGAGASPAQRGLRPLLIGAETLLAVVLTIGAGLLLRSLARIEAVDPGLNPHGVLTLLTGLPDDRYPTAVSQLNYFRTAMERLERVPGVTAAGGIYPLPFAPGNWQESFSLPDRAAPPRGQEPSADIANVRGRYFAAAGVRLLRGRAFTPADGSGAPPVAMVDDVFARRYWPGAGGSSSVERALGQRVELDGPARTIVGVVAHVRDSGVTGVSNPELYIPQAQSSQNLAALYFVLRTRLPDAASLRGPALGALGAVDAGQPVTDIATMEDRLVLGLAGRRQTLELVGLYALLALALASIGVYGVTAYEVTQRRREVGIRMALGSSRARVLATIVAGGLGPAAAGAAGGVILALLLAPGFAHGAALFGIAATDPVAFLAAPALLLGVAGVACLIPARRAASVNPAQTLRSE